MAHRQKRARGREGEVRKIGKIPVREVAARKKQHEELKKMTKEEREEAGDRIVFECKDPSCVLANKVVWAADPGVWQKRQGHVRRCKAADNEKRTTATSMRATPRS